MENEDSIIAFLLNAILPQENFPPQCTKFPPFKICWWPSRRLFSNGASSQRNSAQIKL